VPPGHLLSIPKKEIKERFNIEKVTFYILKILNAHILRQIFYFNMLNHCSGLFNIFLKTNIPNCILLIFLLNYSNSVFGWSILLRESNVFKKLNWFGLNSTVWMEKWIIDEFTIPSKIRKLWKFCVISLRFFFGKKLLKNLGNFFRKVFGT
jgi:hypothetical protein